VYHKDVKKISFRLFRWSLRVFQKFLFGKLSPMLWQYKKYVF